MKINTNPFTLLLGIIMLIIGIGSFLGYSLFPILEGNMTLTYIAIGIAVVLVFTGRIKEAVGTLVISIWLGLMAAIIIGNVVFAYSDIIVSGLPLASGLFLLIGL